MNRSSVNSEIRRRVENFDQGILDQVNPESCLASDEGLYKNALCPHYDQCLEFAVAENWSQFTCQACRFQNSRIEIEPNAREMTGYCRLVARIFLRKDRTVIFQ
jgi:hypothetical protein